MKRPRHRAAPFVPPEVPSTWTMPSPTACAGIQLATRDARGNAPRCFRDREGVLASLARGEVTLDERIRIEHRATTVGRYLVAECLPPSMRPADDTVAWTAARVRDTLAGITIDLNVELAARVADALDSFGCSVAAASGLSLTADDFAPPPGLAALVAQLVDRIRSVYDQFARGGMTDGERWSTTADVSSHAHSEAQILARKSAPAMDPLAVFEAARLDGERPENLRTPGGLQADRSGEVSERPLLHTVSEGLDPHEFMLVARSRRIASVDQSLSDRTVAAMLPDFATVLSDVRIVARECGTPRGVRIRRDELDGAIARHFVARIEGRIALHAVVTAAGEQLVPAGVLLTRTLAARIDASDVVSVTVRDALGCDARDGVCATCFGLDPDDATWPATGDAVGARAVVAIASALRRVRPRRFHIC